MGDLEGKEVGRVVGIDIKVGVFVGGFVGEKEGRTVVWEGEGVGGYRKAAWKKKLLLKLN